MMAPAANTSNPRVSPKMMSSSSAPAIPDDIVNASILFSSFCWATWPHAKPRSPVTEAKAREGYRKRMTPPATADQQRLRSTRKRGEQVAQLLIHFIRGGDSVGDLGPQNESVTLTKPMHRHFYRSV